MGDVSGRLKAALLAGVGMLALGGVAQAQEAAGGAENETTQTGVTSLSLSRVVVSAGAEKVAIDTPQAVSVLDQGDIDDAQASTMGDLLESIPGVSTMGGQSALGQGFNIRGLGTGLADSDSRILFQVDGVTKFFEQYRMGSLFSEPDLYKRVEVLRGPASSTLYGAGALAGVVNFTTKDASDFLEGDDVFALRLRGGYESNAEGGFASAIAAARPIENLDILVMGNIRENDHYENGDGETVIPSNTTSDSKLVKARYYIGGDRSHNIWGSVQVWNSDSTQIYDQAEAFGTTPVRRAVTDTTATLGYENGFAGSDLLDFKAQFSFANSDVVQTETTFLPGLERSEFSYATWQGRAENTAEFSFGEDWNLFVTAGLQASYQERRNPRTATSGVTTGGATTHPEGNMTRFGAFAQAELVWNNRLTIIPGARFDSAEYERGEAGVGAPVAADTEQDGVSPKLAALYNVADWFGVFGSVAHTIRLPVLDEMYSRSTTQAANLDLEPEESDNTELGFTLSFDDVLGQGDAFNFKLTGFQNDVTNLITRGAAGQTYFVNVGESTLEGYEVEAEYGAQNWFGRLGYSAIEGTNELTGAPLTTIPADELNLTLGYIVPNIGLVVGWRGLFAADQNDVPTAAQATEGYNVHNLFATWRPRDGFLEGTDIRLSADNITDEQYQPHLSSLDAEGRTFKISVGHTF